ncbi:dethiobiotin synthase [Nonlabens xiamenensis]|uniref:dethiobiotin synthase n=1 Tax=Nonlabens xiamenensis TaxID=2341043 RepID=UPI000F60A54A|nr:dethiobiotin synthase [Nonlabens xiamenensis]
MNNYFITGIGTDVGKTLAAAIITEALKADYWKPIQSGLEETDASKLRSLISNKSTTIHPEAYRLQTPMSPHKAAEIDGVQIEMSDIVRPITQADLVIEGAGGLLVPINQEQTIADLIHKEDKVILVSSGYLGSINHTLLSLQVLKQLGVTQVGVLYNDVRLEGTIEIIEEMTGIPTLGHLPRLEKLDPEIIKDLAGSLREKLRAL